MDDAIRDRLLQQMQGTAQLHLAYFGVATGILDAFDEPMTVDVLCALTERDRGYVTRWAEAAYAFELLHREESGDEVRYALTELGRAFRRDEPGTLFPMAVQVVLGAHMIERATTLSETGERPGESVLSEQPSLLPLFGPMLEHSFGPVFDAHVVDEVPVFKKVDAEGGLVVDLGCGNGWYLRRLAKRCRHVHGIGLDEIEENVRQAREAAHKEGVGDRLQFQAGDLHHFNVKEPAALIAMNRALHHVWEQGDEVFRILREHLAVGGSAVIWEPAWPDDPSELRKHARFRGMAFQNLAEHVQGNHFLVPEEVAEALDRAGLEPSIHRFFAGSEAIIVGTKR